MASVIYTFLLLSLIGVIEPDSSIDLSSDRVPCGRCVHPPCGRCGLTLVRGGPRARQTTTARPVSTKKTTTRPSTTRRPTRQPTTPRRATTQPTTPRRELKCKAVVTADLRVFCPRDNFSCKDYHTCVPACRRSTRKTFSIIFDLVPGAMASLTVPEQRSLKAARTKKGVSHREILTLATRI